MNKIENYFEVFLIISLCVLFLYMIRSYITPILLASVLVFLCYKPYQKLVKLGRNKSMSAFLILFVIVLVLIYPTYWLITSLVTESLTLFESGKTLLYGVELKNCDSSQICELLNQNLGFIFTSFSTAMISLKEYILGSFGSIFDSFTTFIVQFLIFLLAFFFLLRDGELFIKSVKKIIPMKNSYKNALFLKFKDVLIAVFFNTLFLAVLQGLLVGIGFWVLGIPSSIFWGIIASFAALLPLFGPALVWFPAVLYLFLVGDYFFSVALLLYGLLLVGLIDNLIRPMFLKKKLEVHQFLILISVLGGIQLFGFFLGLFLGPMIISFLVAVLNLYRLDFR